MSICGKKIEAQLATLQESASPASIFFQGTGYRLYYRLLRKSPDITRYADQALKITVQPGDNSIHASSERSELFGIFAGGNADENCGANFYATSIYAPVDWNPPSTMCIVLYRNVMVDTTTIYRGPVGNV